MFFHPIYYTRTRVCPSFLFPACNARNSSLGSHTLVRSSLFSLPHYVRFGLAFLSGEDFSSFFPRRLTSIWVYPRPRDPQQLICILAYQVYTTGSMLLMCTRYYHIFCRYVASYLVSLRTRYLVYTSKYEVWYTAIVLIVHIGSTCTTPASSYGVHVMHIPHRIPDTGSRMPIRADPRSFPQSISMSARFNTSRRIKRSDQPSDQQSAISDHVHASCPYRRILHICGLRRFSL